MAVVPRRSHRSLWEVVVGIVLPLVFFACLVGTTSVLTRRDYLACLVPTFVVATLVMCVGQALLSSFTPPFVLLVMYAAAFPVMLLVRPLRSRVNPGNLVHGILAFAGIYALMAYIDFGRHLISWDEFSHWGVMVKEMLRIDRFYADPASTLMVHKDYPPFASVYELIWCKVACGYSETVVTLALNVLLLSLVVPSFLAVVETSRRSGEARGVHGLATFMLGLLCGVGVLIPLVVFNDTSSSLTIFTDALVSYLFAYSVVLVLSRQAYDGWFGGMAFVLAQVTLILTKQVGIAFICLDVLIYALVAIGDVQVARHSRGRWRGLVGPLVVVVSTFALCLLANRLWAGYVSSLGIEGQFDLSDVSVGAYVAALRGTGEALQVSTLRAYVNALLTQQLFTGSILTVTYSSSLVMALAGLVVTRLVMPRGHSRAADLPLVGVTLVVGWVGYAFMMSILYLFSFDPVEMSELASFNRYMDTYVVGELTVVAYTLVAALVVRARRPVGVRLVAAVVLAGVALLMPAQMQNLVPQALRGNSAIAYQRAAEYLEEKAEPGSHAMIMANNIGQYKYYVHYFSTEIWMENDTSSYTNGYQYLTDPYEGEALDTLLGDVAAHDYVYVIDFNDVLNQALGPYATGGSLTENTVYKVGSQDGQLTLDAQ